jgi:hypothetical protein
VEPRGFEPLTSCLQTMPERPSMATDLRGHVPVSDRCRPLITLPDCTLIARRSPRWPRLSPPPRERHHLSESQRSLLL